MKKDKKVTVAVCLRASTVKALKKEAKEKDTSVSEIVEVALSGRK